MLSIRVDDRNVQQDLAGTTSSCGITTYDGNTLNDVFRSYERSWRDTLCPRIFTIQAVIFLDATVFKFTIQHVAGDAVGQCLPTSVDQHKFLTHILALYNATASFCQGLHDEIPPRTTATDREYRVSGHDNTALRGQLKRSSLRTQPAREWWDMCTGSKFFPAMTLARKWLTAMRHDTQWQTIHVPEQVFEGWRSLAFEGGAKVSDFDLFASWIQLVGASSSPSSPYPSTD